MLKKFSSLLLLQIIFNIFISCSNFDVKNINDSQKIAVVPMTNLTGYDLTKFPALIYKDSELTKLFNSLPPKTINLAHLLETEFERKMEQANVNFIPASKIMQKIEDTTDYSAQRKIILQEFQAEISAHLVLKRVNVSKIFAEQKILIYAGLLIVSNKTGNLINQKEEEFVFELPQSVFSPLGADLSDIITEIKIHIVQKLLE